MIDGRCHAALTLLALGRLLGFPGTTLSAMFSSWSRTPAVPMLARGTLPLKVGALRFLMGDVLPVWPMLNMLRLAHFLL